MSRKRYSREQIIGMLREAEVLLSQGRTTGNVCRQLGVPSRVTIAGARDMAVSRSIRRSGFKELKKENARLHKAVSVLTLDKLILQEATKGNV